MDKNKKRQSSISDCFKDPKQRKVVSENEPSCSTGSSNNITTEKGDESVQHSKPSQPDVQTFTESLESHNNDISNFINRRLRQDEISEALNNIWKPPLNYKFPITTYGQKHLKFQHSWAILRYRCLGDGNLKQCLEEPGKRNKYISPTSQNVIIQCCNNIILRKIVTKVNKSRCFTLLADETSDISGVEQVSICVRYFDVDEHVFREDFLQFVPAKELTGEGIAKTLIENLQEFGVKTKYLRGQGYDGAASMSGKYNGVQAHIKKLHPLAHYVHCSAHNLNLAVSKSYRDSSNKELHWHCWKVA
ncbi:unnamed protein product [Brassicogethes aeneus]|uniref:DUF4371 domain-containing protein n=1 Tax=Brassicogethes aeneus TaxID=1431903 RepID=A0A9P0BGF7_BRAAE|nr:unnamed protein product [Brassicogethes aeneus]